MFTTKHQIIRYNALDKCFQNFGKEYSVDDLLKAVNEVLNDYDNTSIKIRQLRKDIAFMRSAAGYNAPIETYRGASGYYYRYDERAFSINKSPLNDTEAEQLKSAIAILQRFEGSPEFEWVNETATILNDKLGLKDQDKKVVMLDTNPDYTGHKRIAPIFNAIVNKEVLKITYKQFDKDPLKPFLFHPYILKQYNNRWFVFGRNQEQDHNQWNIPLDRIHEMNIEKGAKYIPDTTNWEDYFKDFVGVTKLSGEVEKIVLRFDKTRLKFFTSKPIHSEWDEFEEDGQTYITLDVIINRELVQQLLSYGKDVEIIEPEELKTMMKEHAEIMNSYYKK